MGERELWDAAFDDVWWLDQWGLAPHVVDEIPADRYQRIRMIGEARDDIRQERHKTAQKHLSREWSDGEP